MVSTGHLRYSSQFRPGRSYVIDSKPAARTDGRFEAVVFIAPDPETGLVAPSASIRPNLGPFPTEQEALYFGLTLGRQRVDRHG